MEQYRGRWVIDKARSTGTDGILKLQAVRWALRKAVNMVTVTLDVTLYPKASPDVPSVTATGGLAGTKEFHILDWSEQDHSDYVFGASKHITGLVLGKIDDNGDVYPDIQMKRQVADEKAKRFLRGEVLEDGTASKWSVGGSAPEAAVWVHTFIQSVPEKWTVEQVWGFEEIDGHVCHARRFVAVNKQGEYVLGRAIYKRADSRSESKK